MPSPGLNKVVACLRQSLPPPDGGGLTDGQLLERFLASRDEAAFAALVRRHGPLVFGVCRRVLGNVHDAEDAFQAAFLVLAQKARSVLRRGALGGWLHTVAYRAALEARATVARRRQRERQVPVMPHPAVAPAEPQDWQPLLDRELNRLSEKYRTPVVLCDLEGRTRKEAARQLGLPEGTLSSRLATARRLLARRLAQQGVTFSGGALAVVLSQNTASAHVPMSLVWSTARAASLVAAGQLAAASTPAALLTKGVLKTMFLAKLKAVVATVVVVIALGASGLVCYSGVGQAAPPAKPASELDELRKEIELLKLNLRITLEKIRAQEAELVALKERRDLRHWLEAEELLGRRLEMDREELDRLRLEDLTRQMKLDDQTRHTHKPSPEPDPVADAEAALKAFQAAKDHEGRRKAADELEKATKKLKEQLK
jgi:RNA polymerase sigma factor (sigma-70 family)